MPKKNNAPMPRTLRELDPPNPVGDVDAEHAREFSDLYMDVERYFGKTPGDTERYDALVSRRPGRVPGEPDLSGFSRSAAPGIDERILRAAVASSSIDPEARQVAVERLDALMRNSRPALKQGQHKGQERLSSLRRELVLSIYACAGRTGLPVKTLVGMSKIPDDWMKHHRARVPRELREESRRAGKLAFYGPDGIFRHVDPLKPSEWDDRYSFILGDEPREPPIG